MSAAHAEHVGSIEPRSSTEPTPPSSWQTRMDYSRVAVSRSIVLPAIADADATDSSQVAEPGQPLRIGVGRQLPAMERGDLTETVTWMPLPDGGRVTAFSVRSPGAGGDPGCGPGVTSAGVGIAVLRPRRSRTAVSRIEAERLRRAPGRRARPRRTACARAGRRPSPATPWGIEIEIAPSTHEDEVSLHIVGVSHIHRPPEDLPVPGAVFRRTRWHANPFGLRARAYPVCPNSAVARLTFTDEAGVSYLCTGTAVNSARSRDDNLDTPLCLDGGALHSKLKPLPKPSRRAGTINTKPVTARTRNPTSWTCTAGRISS